MKVVLNNEVKISEATQLIVTVKEKYCTYAVVNGVEYIDKRAEMTCADYPPFQKFIIDLKTGVITNWKKGVTAEIFYKVVDTACYTLLSGRKLAAYKEGYVPEFLAISHEGWGDYIAIDVDANGQIKDWQITAEQLEKYFNE